MPGLRPAVGLLAGVGFVGGLEAFFAVLESPTVRFNTLTATGWMISIWAYVAAGAAVSD